MFRKGTLRTYGGLPHGMATTHADVINADLLAFIKSQVRTDTGAGPSGWSPSAAR
jgi:hypothetical protein